MVLERDNHTCQYCGLSPKDGIKLEIDHKIPRSKGGIDIIDNLITSCFDCNRGKRDFLNYTKLKLEDYTPEIAHNVLPIIEEKMFKNLDKTKIGTKEYREEEKKILRTNSKYIVKMFNL